MRVRTLLLSGALLVATAAACWAVEWPSAKQMTSIMSAVDADLANFSLVGDPEVYTRANLRDLLGPAAEKVFLYEYDWTVAAKYQGPGAIVAADAYRFQDDLNAFGAFSSGRDAKEPSEIIPLDPSRVIPAYWNGNKLHVWRGPFYLRFVPSGPGPELKPQVLELARTVLSKMPPMVKLPDIFKILPARGQIVESMGFEHRNVLGQEGLNNALTVLYGRRFPGRLDIEMEVLLFNAGRGAGATFSALETYLGAAAPTRSIPALGDRAVIVRHPRHGLTYVMQQGGYVVMAHSVKASQNAEALLREVGKNIRLSN